MPRFFLMRLTNAGTLTPVAGVPGEETLEAVEKNIVGRNIRQSDSPLVILEVISTVKIETKLTIDRLPAISRAKHGLA